MTRAERLWLTCFVASFGGLFLLLYPRIYTSLDESACFGMAYILRHGTIYPDRVGYILSMSPLGPYGHLYRFPIGFPACLSLLSYLGSWAMFALNPLCHMGATWCFGKMLRRLNIPVQYAVLYLFYPGFVLYDRTLFSDGFAASLTTFALYFLCGRRLVFLAGVCMGLALMSRSTSLIVTLILAAALVIADLRRSNKTSFSQSDSIAFLAGTLPFLILNGFYNQFTTGHFFRSTYSADMLSFNNLRLLGPLYSASLLLIFPGMLFAPFFYRGWFWREGLIATTVLVLIASSYYESTYGDNLLQTLISVSRQILPAMPFYLLAYVGVLSRLVPERRLKTADSRTSITTWGAGILLLLVAAGLSAVHQQHLKNIIAMRTEIRQTLPQQAIIYGNKDVFKLHQPAWEPTIYRELTTINEAEVAGDLGRNPVYVVLSFRSRGIAHEDVQTQQVLNFMQNHLVVKDGPTSPSGRLQYYRVMSVKEHTRL